MHEQTEILTVSHTNTHSHGQQSGCWLLPVGLWSLNCLSDSTLSKFTMRDPALCLPEPLRLKHTQKRTCSQMQPKHRQTYTHSKTHTHTMTVHTTNHCSLDLGKSSWKVGFGFYLNSESNILSLNFQRASQRSVTVHSFIHNEDTESEQAP